MKIRTKIFLHGIFSTVVMAGSFSFFTPHLVRSLIMEKSEDHVILELNEVEEETKNLFEKGDEQRFLKEFRKFLIHTDLAYIAALDTSGRVLAHSNVVEHGKTYPTYLAQIQKYNNRPFLHIVNHDGLPFLRGTMAIRKDRKLINKEELLFSMDEKKEERPLIGFLQIEAPIKKSLDRAARISFQIVLLIIVFSVLITTILLSLLNRILSPIPHLVEATEKISRGMFGDMIPVETKDELGALANRFNTMSQVLSETTISKNFLSQIIDNLPDIIIVTSSEDIIEMCNKTTSKLLGYSAEELIGTKVHTLFEKNSVLFHFSNQYMFTENGFISNVETNIATNDGKNIPIDSAIVRINDASQKKDKHIYILHDVREIKNLIAQIIQAEKLAALGEIGAGFAHEFNTPLAVILGYLEMAKKRMPQDNPLLPLIDTALEETVHCGNLIKEFLFFARPTDVEAIGKFEPVDIHETVNRAMRLIGYEITKSNVQIQVQIEDPCPLIKGMAKQLTQVFMNLINNSIQAMDRGGQIVISAKKVYNTMSHSFYLEFRVSDNGSGISKENIARIFDPFFTTKRPGKGTGLGLSIVMRIISNHKGTIRVESELGQGTTFIGELPLW